MPVCASGSHEVAIGVHCFSESGVLEQLQPLCFCKLAFKGSRFSLSVWRRSSLFWNACWSYSLSYRKGILASPKEICLAFEMSCHCFCITVKWKSFSAWRCECQKPLTYTSLQPRNCLLPFLFQPFLRTVECRKMVTFPQTIPVIKYENSRKNLYVNLNEILQKIQVDFCIAYF